MEALEDEDEEVRIAAARALGICAPVSVDILLGLLEHEEPFVRRRAAVELGKAGVYAEVDAALALIKALNSSDVELKTAATWALGSIGETTEGTVETLSKALEDDNDRVREKAAWALGNMKTNTQDPISRLMKLLSDGSKQVREKAVWALGKICANSSRAKPAAPLLIEALSDDDWAVRKAASQALGRIGPFAITALPMLARVNENMKDKEVVWRMAGWAIDEISKYERND